MRQYLNSFTGIVADNTPINLDPIAHNFNFFLSNHFNVSLVHEVSHVSRPLAASLSAWSASVNKSRGRFSVLLLTSHSDDLNLAVGFNPREEVTKSSRRVSDGWTIRQFQLSLRDTNLLPKLPWVQTHG